MMSNPVLIDDDAGTITVTVDGVEVRSWSYFRSRAERVNKMTRAREFVEGWTAAQAAAPDRWRDIETAPKDTAVLVYGFMYDVAHYNTHLDAWVACWDHRKITVPYKWMPVPKPPKIA